MPTGGEVAFWSGTVADFLAADPATLVLHLTDRHTRRFSRIEAQQRRAWEICIPLLQGALRGRQAEPWRVLLEYPILRLGRRIDAVLVTDRAVLVLEFKVGECRFHLDDLRQVEDYALDLLDFHAESRGHAVVPVLVATEAPSVPLALPLALPGLVQPIRCGGSTLTTLLERLPDWMPRPRIPVCCDSWETAPYRPVPGIIEAARTLYDRHSVAEIATAHADATNLSVTTGALRALIRAAREENTHRIAFVTGIPGAGKTLCGLDVVFGAGRTEGTTFLTGNPALVNVLREALARDAATRRDGTMRAARHEVGSAIQPLPAFRDHYVARDEIPPEHVAVIDEAQRCWSRDHAVRKTRDRPVKLAQSEPAHLLDIMARQPDWSVLVCLIGGGQEIHTGEGGLAEWGAALRARPEWRAVAAPDATASADPRQRLAGLPDLEADPALHLAVPVRSIRSSVCVPWTEAVLAGDARRARRLAGAEGGVPFHVTRDLGVLRRRLGDLARGARRAGLVTSSGAARLRAEGLGTELPHMDAGAVARWFLDRFPADVRASDALELPATEFSCQGLELDYVGLCWDGDLVREDGRSAWRAREFRGTDWTLPRGQEAISNRINAYRVLLTRARYATLIWVPRGDAADRTRAPAVYDGIARFLLECGATTVS